MKKIGLITIHYANNYGAVLQAFATTCFLKKFGQVSLINYCPPHIAKEMQVIRFGLNARAFLHIAKDLFRLFPRYRVISKFKRFIHSMPLTKEIKSQADFDECFRENDIFIAGSDQIWNPLTVGGGEINRRYLLDFVHNKPKVSYASSLGGYICANEDNRALVHYLRSFKAISVREKKTADYLNSVLSENKQNVFPVIDPTLLFKGNEWCSLFNLQEENSKSSAPFILVYALKKDALLRRTVNYYRKKLNYQVISIDQDPFIPYKADKHIKDASPKEFISLFSSAQFVITNSFHGVCFSVIFNKQFVATTPAAGANRIVNLLEMLELGSRFITKEISPSIIKVDIDYQKINVLLNDKREQAKAFLETAMDKSRSINIAAGH